MARMNQPAALGYDRALALQLGANVHVDLSAERHFRDVGLFPSHVVLRIMGAGWNSLDRRTSA